ncbi:histidine phosphatase family protein [Aureimonas populi]|uniref:Histidine phosphatase family protein n=1 Tax=Aureimonas populi TaxID=1701758 RepID=A0ABW5CMV5_9HYPH|nr:histidine phosphatase family protein [Aureimonas populi]
MVMPPEDFLGGRFLFLRHGQTPANAAGIVAGVTDIPLSPTGEAQARAAAELLAGMEFTSIWTSALTRAIQTAEAVATLTGRPLHRLPELGERNWGAWEGGPRSIIRREATPPGGEGPDAFAGRVRRGLARIAPPHPVLIVAHSGTARVLWQTLLPHEPFRRPDNAALSEWRRGGDGLWRVIDPKSCCHRPVAEDA